MNPAKLLLNAYYEVLYERLEAGRDLLAAKIDQILSGEIARHGFEDFDEHKFAAYRDACLAFVDERIETYNPTGIQYTFDRIRTKQARELELQLDWYDSRAEFELLLHAVREKARDEMSEERLRELADELIHERGAFPDKSIISEYEAQPAVVRLPDYVVSQAIEGILH